MTRFGVLVDRVDVRGKGIDLPLMSVSQFRGVIRRSEISDGPHRADSLDDYKIAKRGDIVFNKMSIRDGAMGLAREDGLVTYHYEVMRPRPAVEARYVVYLMKSSWFGGELIKRERGIGAGGAKGVRTTEVPFRVLRTIDCYIPTVEGQRAIADFLDRETAQIDSMIEAQNVLMQELRERQRAAISNTIDSDASLQRVPLRRLITGISQGWSPQCEDTPVDDPSTQWSVLKVGCVNGGVFRPKQNKMLPGDLEPRPELGLRAGDLLMSRGNTREWVGSAAVVDRDYPTLMLSDLLYRVAVDRSLVSSEYVALALSTRKARDEIEIAAKGASHSMQKVSQGDIRSTTIPLRSLQAQADVVNEASAITVRADAMISAAQEVIDLLRERREALITAAVTGRIDPETGTECIEEGAA